MADIPAGFFYMGGNGEGSNYDEAPIHKVTLTKPFKMSVTEITNAQGQEITKNIKARYSQS